MKRLKARNVPLLLRKVVDGKSVGRGTTQCELSPNIEHAVNDEKAMDCALDLSPLERRDMGCFLIEYPETAVFSATRSEGEIATENNYFV